MLEKKLYAREQPMSRLLEKRSFLYEHLDVNLLHEVIPSYFFKTIAHFCAQPYPSTTKDRDGDGPNKQAILESVRQIASDIESLEEQTAKFHAKDDGTLTDMHNEMLQVFKSFEACEERLYHKEMELQSEQAKLHQLAKEHQALQHAHYEQQQLVLKLQEECTMHSELVAKLRS